MRYIPNYAAGLLVTVMMAGACLAEDATPPPKFYKLDFVVKEVEGTKVVNARTYSVTASDEKPGTCSIRTGTKVPYSTGKDYTYLDVGVNIDCRNLRETPAGLSAWVNAEVSSVATESTMTPERPFVRQVKWGSFVVVPLKKPTVIFYSDDLTDKHQTQLELTATPIM